MASQLLYAKTCPIKAKYAMHDEFSIFFQLGFVLSFVKGCESSDKFTMLLSCTHHLIFFLFLLILLS